MADEVDAAKSSAQDVTVTFINPTRYHAWLIEMDESHQGVRRFIGLRARSEVQHPSFAGRHWMLLGQQGHLGDEYICTAEARQETSWRLKRPSATRTIAVTFENLGWYDADFYRLDADLNEHPAFGLDRGAKLQQTASTDDIWVIRSRRNNAVMSMYRAGHSKGAVEIHRRDGPPVEEFNLAFLMDTQFTGETVELTLVNDTPFVLELLALKPSPGLEPAGQEELLQPGASLTVSAHAGGSWHAERKEDPEGFDWLWSYDVTSEAQQQFHIRPKPQEARPAVPLTIRNHTPETVRLEWAAPAANPTYTQFGELAPYGVREVPTFEGHLWRANFFFNELAVWAARADGSAFDIDATRIASPQGSAPTRVLATNTAPFAVQVAWRDSEGHEQGVELIAAGESREMRSVAGHVWVAKEPVTQGVLGLHLAGRGLDWPIKMVSPPPGDPAKVGFVNRTMLTVELHWVDSQGTPKLMKVLPPGDATRYGTRLNHVWLVLDARSKCLVDRCFVKAADQTVEITDEDLWTARQSRAVKVNFHNGLPETADLFTVSDQGQNRWVATLAPGQSMACPSVHGEMWRLRSRHSRTVIGLFLAGKEEEQECTFQSLPASDKIATEIEFFNETPLDVAIYAITAAGEPELRGSLAPREAVTLQTFATHPFIVRDQFSETGLAITVATPEPQLLRITGRSLRPVPGPDNLTLQMTNFTSLPLTLCKVDEKGKNVPVGELEPMAAVQLATRKGQAYRFMRGDDEVDLYIAPDHPVQDYLAKDMMTETPMRASGRLYPGEVALFSEPAFAGEGWIVWRDVADCSLVGNTNDDVESILLGPSTTCAAFVDNSFQGQNDVFAMSMPALGNTDVKSDSISSLKVFTQPTSGNPVLGSTALLTEDYRTQNGELLHNADGSLQSCTVFRSTITFASDVRMVEIWASEQVKITVNGRNFGIDAVAGARFKVDASQKLVVTLAADQLATPSLQLRTNTMGASERVFVFPDQDAHDKVSSLPNDALWNRRAELGIDPALSQANCAHVQSAIRNLALAMKSVGGAPGRERRLVVADNMDVAAWALDLGGASGSRATAFRPISPDEAARLSAGAVSVDDRVSQGLFDNFAQAATIVIEPFKSAARTAATTVQQQVVNPVSQVVTAAAQQAHDQVFKPVADAVEQVVAPVVQAVVTAADQVHDQVFEPVAQAFQQQFEKLGAGIEGALKITIVDVGGQVVEFVADTVQKVAAVGKQVIEQIGSTVEKVLDTLRDTFAWDDMLKTHDLLMDLMNQALGRAGQGIESLKLHLGLVLKNVRSEVIEQIDTLLEQLGVKKALGDNQPQQAAFAGKEHDSFHWFSSKLLSNADQSDAKVSGGEFASAADLLNSLIEVLGRRVEQDGPEVLAAAQRAVANLAQAVQEPARAPALLLGVLLELVKAAALVAIGVVDAVMEIVLNVLAAMLQGLRRFLTATIEIPFISGLYKALTRGRALSMLSLGCLFLAIPFTVVTKLTLGRAPHQLLGRLALDAGDAMAAKGLALLGVTASMTMSVLDALLLLPKPNGAQLMLACVNSLMGAALLLATHPFGFKPQCLAIDHSHVKNWQTEPDYWAFVLWYVACTALAMQVVFSVLPRLPGVVLAESAAGGLEKGGALALMLLGMINFALMVPYLASTRTRALKASPGFVDRAGDEVAKWKGAPFGRLAAVVTLSSIPPLFAPVAEFTKDPRLKAARLVVGAAFTVAIGGIVVGQIKSGDLD